jgi:hypothetical protein
MSPIGVLDCHDNLERRSKPTSHPWRLATLRSLRSAVRGPRSAIRPLRGSQVWWCECGNVAPHRGVPAALDRWNAWMTGVAMAAAKRKAPEL